MLVLEEESCMPYQDPELVKLVVQTRVMIHDSDELLRRMNNPAPPLQLLPDYDLYLATRLLKQTSAPPPDEGRG
jgi:hypothetical protein